MAVNAIKDGAFDFIEKPFDAEQLIETIGFAIARGQRDRIERDARTQLRTLVADLSPRQVEVMRLVAEGFSNNFPTRRSRRNCKSVRARWRITALG